MPYVKQVVRDRIGLQEALNDLPEKTAEFPLDPGELNYVLTMIIRQYIISKSDGHITYQLLNEVDGVLGLCQAEFRRRIVYPYEDKKIQENGDVWDGVL